MVFVVYLFLLALAVVSGDGAPSTSSTSIDAVCASQSPAEASGSDVLEFEADSEGSRVDSRRRLSLVTPRRRESVLTVMNNEGLEAEVGCKAEG